MSSMRIGEIKMSPSIATQETVNQDKICCNENPGRAMIWAIPSRYHFTIISFCLTAHERMQFIESLNISKSNRCQFEMINSILHLTYRKSSYGVDLQKILDQKFQLSIKKFQAVQDEESLETRWNSSLKQGDLRGVFWAVISHGSASSAIREKIFKEVSLYSFESCCKLFSSEMKNRALEQKVSKTNVELSGLKDQYQRSVCRYCKHISSLSDDLEVAKYEVQRLERHLSLFEHKKNNNA